MGRAWQAAIVAAVLAVGGAAFMRGVGASGTATSGVGATSASAPAAPGTQIGPSGLPIPRFVSIRSVPVNIRRGPTRDHEIIWTYQKAGVPVEVIQEFENWRRIRDADGQDGWVLQTLLSGRRTALIAPWEGKVKTLTPIFASRETTAKIAAMAEPNVLVDVRGCQSGWCTIEGDGFSGYIEARHLYGVKPDETID